MEGYKLNLLKFSRNIIKICRVQIVLPEELVLFCVNLGPGLLMFILYLSVEMFLK